MLRQHSRNFGDVKVTAEKFEQILNTKLLLEDTCEGVVVEDCLAQQRTRTKKRMDGESASDEIGNLDEDKN